MSAPAAIPPPLPVLPKSISPGRTLRRLFLTLFLRGRSSRGLKKDKAPKSVGQKLALTLLFYGAFGLIAIAFQSQNVFALSIYLHAMTFVFLGMFVASSSGEVLFNKEEADILLHRPITPRALLYAKIGVLVEVSLWLAGAFNLSGLIVGTMVEDGGWLYPLVHAFSTVLEALFCTSSVVLIYQLCLRWFGRERLDGLMTMAQMLVAILAVVGGQIPRLLMSFGGTSHLDLHSWWIACLPPAWFAGFDDALVTNGPMNSWLLGGLGVVATAVVLWLAFGKLAADYETGLQNIGETASRRPRKAGRRWIDWLTGVPPFRWWLRDSVSRASFLLVAAYLVRDRDVKLRIYPGLAPMLVMPFIIMLPSLGHHNGGGALSGPFGVAFAGVYLGIVPMLGLNFLKYSQQWQAADIFRIAPMRGPAALSHGVRRAVLCFLAFPILILFTLIVWLLSQSPSTLLLLLPGAVAMPVYSLIPCLGNGAVPLSLPNEEAKSAGRGLNMLGAMLVSFALAGVAWAAWTHGWFWWLILGETMLVIGLYAVLHARIGRQGWETME